MKKLLIATLLVSSTAMAEPSTNDRKTVGDFIKAGGFHALCDKLQWQWGYINGISPACFSDRYAKRNGWHYNPADNTWTN